MKNIKSLIILLLFFLMPFCYSQNDSVTNNRKDILDVLYKLFHKNDSVRINPDKKVAFSLLPVPV
ncbi:MAG: hypothetical protein WAM46_08655, partial [Flavobacterium sp.]